MTDQHLTPPPELVQQWRDTATMKTVLEIGTSQAPPDEVMVNGVRYVPATDVPAATPDPAPTADGGVPLWKAMHAAYERVLQEDALESGHFYAAELRAVADWLERMGHGTPWMGASEVFATSLRAEAERAEAGEVGNG